MCTISTLLLCLIVPRLVYAGWPIVKYKNGTVGILNDDGDVHVQNTNLFVYGKKVVHPEKCAPPGGRSQYFNGTEWMCLCEDGWSGLTCEIEEQMPWSGTVNNGEVTLNGDAKSNYTVYVWHADVHTSGYAYVQFHYVDGVVDEIRHTGNGSRKFLKSDGTWTGWFAIGSHGATLRTQLGLVKYYDIDCTQVAGTSTWYFTTLSGHVSKIVLKEDSGWGGMKSVEVYGASTNNTPLTDSTFHSAISECLKEAPIDGLCVDYGSTSGYGVLPDWDVSQVVNMGGDKCTDADGDGTWDCILVGFANTAFNGNISRWDTSSVYYMHDMFRGAYAFNQPIGVWNLSNVNKIQNMFNGASAFNQPLDGWDVSNVYNMNGLFKGASSFNQPIESWVVSSVTEMEEMFEDAQSFNQPLGGWDVSSVTSMYDMFEGAISFNSPIDSASSSYYGWETSQVTSMEDMFRGAYVFNQYIGGLNVSRVQSMFGMFEDAHSFDQPIHGWDVSSVTSMGDMFQRAYSFNRPIGNWNTSSVTNMDLMFDDASAFEQEVSQWKGPAATSVSTDRNIFYGATAFLAEFSCSVHGPASVCLRKYTGPPKCVPPGGDKLQYNGTNWICVCASGWTGDTCEIEPIFYLCGWSGKGLTGVEAWHFCHEHHAYHLDIRPNDANATLILDTFKYTPEFAALAQESDSNPWPDSASVYETGGVGDRMWTSVEDAAEVAAAEDNAEEDAVECYNTNWWNPREYGDAGVGTRDCNSMGTFPICVSLFPLTFEESGPSHCVAAPAQLPLRQHIAGYRE